MRIVFIVLDDFQIETRQRVGQFRDQMIVVGRYENGAKVISVLSNLPLNLFHDRFETRIAQLFRRFSVFVSVSQTLRGREQQRVLGDVLASTYPINAVSQVNADELARFDSVVYKSNGQVLYAVAPFQVPVNVYVFFLYRETRGRSDKRQHRPFGRRILFVPLGRHVVMVNVVVERSVELGRREIHAVSVPKRLEGITRFRVASVRLAPLHVTEGRPILGRPQIVRTGHKVVHQLDPVVLQQRADPEVRVERDLYGFRLTVTVLDPMRQQQRAVQGSGETDGAQEMIGLVAETAHTRAVGDVAGRVAGKRETQKTHGEQQVRGRHGRRREKRTDRERRVSRTDRAGQTVVGNGGVRISKKNLLITCAS